MGPQDISLSYLPVFGLKELFSTFLLNLLSFNNIPGIRNSKTTSDYVTQCTNLGFIPFLCAYEITQGFFAWLTVVDLQRGSTWNLF